MHAGATVGPITVSVDASAWGSYEEGVFQGCNLTSPTIDHAVQLVGYGTSKEGLPYFLVRNSWSPRWGEDGSIRIFRQVGAAQTCGVDTEPAAGSSCLPYPPNITACNSCGITYDVSYPVA